MYTLYYLNKNLQIHTIKVESLDEPLLIPEDLVFCDLRKGINFIKEPHKCIDFTDIERLMMQSEFNDINLIKEADYRKQNTYLNPLCIIDPPVYIEFWARVGIVDCVESYKTVLATSTDMIYKSTEIVEEGTILYDGNKNRIKNKLVLDFGGNQKLYTTDLNGVVVLIEDNNLVPCQMKNYNMTFGDGSLDRTQVDGNFQINLNDFDEACVLTCVHTTLGQIKNFPVTNAIQLIDLSEYQGVWEIMLVRGENNVGNTLFARYAQ